MPAAAIFDLDGTLLDTLEDLADSANEALEACGFAAHPVEAYRTFVGDGMAVLMDLLHSLPSVLLHVLPHPQAVTAPRALWHAFLYPLASTPCCLSYCV